MGTGINSEGSDPKAIKNYNRWKSLTSILDFMTRYEQIAAEKILETHMGKNFLRL